MNAQEAEKKSIERQPLYDKEMFEIACKEIYGLIEKAVNDGHEFVTGGWNLQGIWRNGITEKLRADGYYVRYRYTGASMDIVIAWGKKIKAFKENDIERERMEDEWAIFRAKKELDDKKWCNIVRSYWDSFWMTLGCAGFLVIILGFAFLSMVLCLFK